MTLTLPSGMPRILPLRSAAQIVPDCSRRRAAFSRSVDGGRKNQQAWGLLTSSCRP